MLQKKAICARRCYATTVLLACKISGLNKKKIEINKVHHVQVQNEGAPLHVFILMSSLLWIVLS